MPEIWQIVLLAGVLTYVTRIAGHLVIARLGRIHPRLDAALNAVPAAVLTTILVPVIVDGSWAERLILLLCGLAAIRVPLIVAVLAGVAAVALVRQAGF